MKKDDPYNYFMSDTFDQHKGGDNMISKNILNIGMILLILGLIFFFLVLFFRPLLGLEPVFGAEQTKVTVCHKTHSETNEWVEQTINANELESHIANGDFLADEGHPCPPEIEDTITPTPTVTPTATPSAQISTPSATVTPGVTQGPAVTPTGEAKVLATELPNTGFDQTLLLGILGLGLIGGGLALKPWKKFED